MSVLISVYYDSPNIRGRIPGYFYAQQSYMYKILVHMYTFISLKNVGDIYDEICIFSTQEKFEDTKEVIRSHKSKILKG